MGLGGLLLHSFGVRGDSPVARTSGIEYRFYLND